MESKMVYGIQGCWGVRQEQIWDLEEVLKNLNIIPSEIKSQWKDFKKKIYMIRFLYLYISEIF